ncbi:Heat shock protein 70kD, peptide-binding domain [Phytophthora cactorum]|nr:Heat shock protein 70kD, peptide-binding domain [Phytophthora cactorum]
MTTNTYDSWGSSAERFADGSICLGIDLGTTNSCVGMWHVDRNHVKILKNRLDRGRTTPSMVRFNPNNQSVDVGNVAIGLETSEPVGNTIRSVKRLMGQKFESKAVDVARIYAAYEVAPTAQGNVAAQVVRGHKKVQRHDVTRAQVEPADMVGLKREVERAKIELSEEEHADITVNDIAGVSKFTHTLTRRKFEQLCDPIWKKCLRIVLSVLKEADVEATDMDEVILVGGSTRIPVLRTKISEAFNGRELCMSVNADEVVCEGAAIQAAILSGMDQRVFRDVLMMDVLPLPIGLETADGTMEIILSRNARIPTTVTKHFQTYEDGQRGLTVEVYEGEKEIAKENDHICYFNFALPRDKIGKAGEFAHPVTFTMNASGILQVQAGVHHDSEESPMSKVAIFLMGAYILALFGFYLFFRIYFVDERDITA